MNLLLFWIDRVVLSFNREHAGVADLLCFCGDSPAVGEAIGFKESASANLPCRQCIARIRRISLLLIRQTLISDTETCCLSKPCLLTFGAIPAGQTDSG